MSKRVNIQEVFILATGIAALIHSTWSLGTIFSGPQPAVEDIESMIEVVHFIGWLLPSLLIAIALDVGQIATSHQIRTHGMNVWRVITFLVFSVATFYLQWLYMMHHIPLITIGEGVSETYMKHAVWLRDFGLFLVPALLPLATILYTLSGDSEQPEQQPEPLTMSVSEVPVNEPITLPEYTINLLEAEHPRFTAVCECGWSKDYDNADSERRGLAAHQQKCNYFAEIAESEVINDYVE